MNNMCDSVRKRPSSVLSSLGIALQCGARRRRDGDTASHTNNCAGLICIDVEENVVEGGHATSSGGINMARIHDKRFGSQACEDDRQQAKPVPVNDAEICSPTQAWPPVPMHKESQIHQERPQPRSLSPVRSARSERLLWSPHLLRGYCEELAEGQVSHECLEESWSPHRLRGYCENIAKTSDA